MLVAYPLIVTFLQEARLGRPAFYATTLTIILACGGCAEGSGPEGGGGAGAATSTDAVTATATAGTTAAQTSGAGGGATTASTTTGGPACGDGVVDTGELCDGPPADSCFDLGYFGGVLGCLPDCTFDLSMCDGCHNGVIEPETGEDCDFDAQGDPLVLASCASLGFPMSGANPGCADDCEYDIKICMCGNGALDALEVCDGALLGGNTCQTEGFVGGTLACSPDCELDTSGCTGSVCGNGAVEAGEQCDDGNTTSGDGCSSTCQTEIVSCDPDGTYVIQGSPVSYTCCLGLVSINVSSFIFSSDGASIGSSPSNPVPMTGSQTTCPSGSFTNTGNIPGGCAETYTLQGSYLDADTWSGTYQVQFTGADCSCFSGMLGTPCVNQLFSITAMR